jgi:hypothetical protein
MDPNVAKLNVAPNTGDWPEAGYTRSFFGTILASIAGAVSTKDFLSSEGAIAASKVTTAGIIISLAGEVYQDIKLNPTLEKGSIAVLLTGGKYFAAYGVGRGVGALFSSSIIGIPLGVGAGALSTGLYQKYITTPVQEKYNIQSPYKY